jgi:hypothetical protein
MMSRSQAAQDLAELDIDLAAITQAGGWKSTRMPAAICREDQCGEVGNGAGGGGQWARRRGLRVGIVHCGGGFTRVSPFTSRYGRVTISWG